MDEARNVARARDLILLAGDVAIGEGLAEDAVAEFPFAPSTMPKRLEGRAAVVDFMRTTRAMFSSLVMHIDTAHATRDPNTVIVEHNSDGVVAENGRTYRNRYVTLLAFNDAGQVTLWREYFDPGVVFRAFRRS